MIIQQQHCEANKGLKISLAELYGTGTCFCNVNGRENTVYVILDGENLPSWWLQGDSLPVLCLNNGRIYHYPKNKEVIVVSAELNWTRRNILVGAARVRGADREPAVQEVQPPSKVIQRVATCTDCKYFVPPGADTSRAPGEHPVPRCSHQKMHRNILPYTYAETGMVHAVGIIPDRCPLPKSESIEGARVA